MNDRNDFPELVYIEANCFDLPATQTILKRLPHVPHKIISSTVEMQDDFISFTDPIGAGKRFLLLAEQKGDFIKPCPCTPDYIGCNYFIINLDLNCPLDCTYCILQQYLSDPWLTLHVNTVKLWQQLDVFLSKIKHPLRIGTGELGDSLVLDHITRRSQKLISYFRRHPHAILELKTKTLNIRNILETEAAENIVIAWSLNAEQIAKTDEKGAPSSIARIKAAAQVVKRGYRVAFHFDPIIRFSGWKEGYAEVVDQLLTHIPAARIAWISMGTLRFTAALKPVIRERFPASRIIYEEFVRGKDGKYRYFRPLRVELYKELVHLLRRAKNTVIPLYFCMENKTVWRDVLKKEPRGRDVEKSLTLPLGS